MSTHGFDGNQPVHLRPGHRDSGSTTPPQAPRRITDNNQKTAQQIAKGVETWDFDGQQVAAHIVSMDSAHQRRIADIVFHLVRMWGHSATRDYNRPGHPMHAEYEQARRMLTGPI